MKDNQAVQEDQEQNEREAKKPSKLFIDLRHLESLFLAKT